MARAVAVVASGLGLLALAGCALFGPPIEDVIPDLAMDSTIVEPPPYAQGPSFEGAEEIHLLGEIDGVEAYAYQRGEDVCLAVYADQVDSGGACATSAEVIDQGVVVEVSFAGSGEATVLMVASVKADVGAVPGDAQWRETPGGAVIVLGVLSDEERREIAG